MIAAEFVMSDRAVFPAFFTMDEAIEDFHARYPVCLPEKNADSIMSAENFPVYVLSGVVLIEGRKRRVWSLNPFGYGDCRTGVPLSALRGALELFADRNTDRVEPFVWNKALDVPSSRIRLAA